MPDTKWEPGIHLFPYSVLPSPPLLITSIWGCVDPLLPLRAGLGMGNKEENMNFEVKQREVILSGQLLLV